MAGRVLIGSVPSFRGFEGASYEDIAGILADSPATVRRHYAKRTPEYQTRQDRTLALVHGTTSAQTEANAASC